VNILEARQVTKVYTIEDRQIPVLENISLCVAPGEFLVIEGSSGSGKTTLLSLLSGLDKPTAGQVLIEEIDITDTSEDDLAPLRNEVIGFVFQAFHLVPQALLARVGLERRGANFPHQLSGGEMQRVAMCRALINNPKIIFADEPTGNLDSENGRAILELFLEFQRERQSTLILVTHNKEIARMADRIIVLHDGVIIEEVVHDRQHTA